MDRGCGALWPRQRASSGPRSCIASALGAGPQCWCMGTPTPTRAIPAQVLAVPILGLAKCHPLEPASGPHSGILVPHRGYGSPRSACARPGPILFRHQSDPAQAWRGCGTGWRPFLCLGALGAWVDAGHIFCSGGLARGPSPGTGHDGELARKPRVAHPGGELAPPLRWCTPSLLRPVSTCRSCTERVGHLALPCTLCLLSPFLPGRDQCTRSVPLFMLP